MFDIESALRSEKINFVSGISAAELSTFRGGGRVGYTVFPETVCGLQTILKIAREQDIPFRIVGAGSNTLIPDCGFDGILISTKKFKGIWVEQNVIISGAGEKLGAVASAAARRGLSGLEPLAGIPASIGGAAYMNAGAFGTEISNLITSVTLVSSKNGELHTLMRGEIEYSYRSSGNSFAEAIILSVRFELKKETVSAQEKMRYYAEKRLLSQPNEPSLGSVFKRAQGISAGFYVDKAGLKGVRVGGAEISPKHANFIVNKGGATANDYLALVNLCKSVVKRKFDIELEEEFKILT